MRFKTLDEWLAWQEGLHPTEIDLGLERIQKVLASLDLAQPGYSLITVAGTNGKGSSVAMLESVYRAAGYRVAAYTSPHLLRYNERIRIDGEPVADDALCHAFEVVDQARGDTSLSYFEFGTLAAIEIFAHKQLDVVIMEVGLGGRLDAVNVLDPDVALITPIAMDHADWLGDDRESIGREKAGIMRAGRPVVCGDANPPATVLEAARTTGARLKLIGKDFNYSQMRDGQWRWWSEARQREALPEPSLRGSFQRQNAAAVLMVVDELAACLPVSQANIREGLANTQLAGRFQVIPGDVPLVLDVAHNPQAALALADNLKSWPMPGRIFAVTAMMADKDIAGIFAALMPVVDEWHVTTIAMPRAASSEALSQVLLAQGAASSVRQNTSVTEALCAAQRRAGLNDRIVVFGSFYTVAEASQAAYNAGSRNRAVRESK